jgi:hypothetical protein
MFSFLVEEEKEEKAWLQHVFGTRMQLDGPRPISITVLRLKNIQSDTDTST